MHNTVSVHNTLTTLNSLYTPCSHSTQYTALNMEYALRSIVNTFVRSIFTYIVLWRARGIHCKQCIALHAKYSDKVDFVSELIPHPDTIVGVVWRSVPATIPRY